MGEPEAPAFDVRSYATAVAALDPDALSRVLAVLIGAWERDATVFLCGNGGSASAASHFATDLTKPAVPTGVRAMRAVALGDNPALLTAVANDLAYADVFALPLRALARPGDVLVAISASGASPNIVAALREAAALGLETVAFTGFSGGVAREVAGVAVHVPVDHYGIVETAHAAATHVIAYALRGRLAQRQEQ